MIGNTARRQSTSSLYDYGQEGDDFARRAHILTTAASRIRLPVQPQQLDRIAAAPTTADSDFEVLKVIELPQFIDTGVRDESFAAMQEWEGTITSVGVDVFTASLIDVTAGGREPEEEIELPIEDVNDEDAGRVRVGAIFRLVVGYARRAGRKTRGTEIYFRRVVGRGVEDDETPDLTFAITTDGSR